VALQWTSQDPVASHPVTLSKSYVPGVCLTLANSLVLSFVALIEINKLCLSMRLRIPTPSAIPDKGTAQV
jgi:hypothetical protein